MTRDPAAVLVREFFGTFEEHTLDTLRRESLDILENDPMKPAIPKVILVITSIFGLGEVFRQGDLTRFGHRLAESAVVHRWASEDLALLGIDEEPTV